MTTYKFTTKIQEDGTIKLPKDAVFSDEEVLITITSKQIQESVKPSTKATDFVQKWAGFMKDVDVEDAEYNYLLEKYE
jgi:hypothetical protein